MGCNIVIVAGLLMLVGTKAVGKRWAVWTAIGGIALYTILVGADAAVVRAAIMGGLFVLALYLGRQAEMCTSLIFAATVMTTANLCLRWDVGLAATVRLIWLTPPLEQVAERGAVNHLQLVQQLPVRITQEGPIRAPENPPSRW